jgi:hypothetical protein
LREELQLEREERENTVVVVASSAEPIVEENNFTKRKKIINCGIAVFFVAIGVVVGVVAGVTPSAPTPSPATSPPTMIPTIEPLSSPTKPSRFDSFLKALLDQDPDLEVLELTNPSTPQGEALSWLASKDELNLDPETAPGIEILERFVLATFYYATDGLEWSNQFKFLQGRFVCEWNNGQPLASGLFGGIGCNETAQVSHLIMGKLVLLFHVIAIRLGTATGAFLTSATKSTNRQKPSQWDDSHRTMAACGFGAY